MAVSEPKFTPKPGQTDYTNIRYAPVINIVVTQHGKILLVQRSTSMRLYPNYWNGVSGFLDDDKSVEQKMYEELHEELNIQQSGIESFELGQVLLQEAPEYKKTWLVVPVLVRAKTDKFKFNWEAQRAQWFEPQEIISLNLLPGFEELIRQFISID